MTSHQPTVDTPTAEGAAGPAPASPTPTTGGGAIALATEIPGPVSRAWNTRREQATAPGVAQLAAVTIASGDGAVVTDVDGNRLLDFAGGIGALALGHCHPEVVAATARQAESLVHMAAIVANYPGYVEVAERLNSLAPGAGVKRTILNTTGAEAVETAVKIARAATGRSAILVFEGAYHGRTNLTMAMTSKYSLFKRGFGPFAPEVYRAPYPGLFPTERDGSPDDGEAIARLQEVLVAHVAPEELAAVVIEPVLGEGGFVPAPAPFLRALRQVCDDHGIVMIADEIQSGFGRTGRMFAIEHAGVAPDMITVAKSFANGMPLAAVVGRDDLMTVPHPGGLGGTYGGNPVACAAALVAMDTVSDPAFLSRAADIGVHLRSALSAMAARHPDRIDSVQGLGPMLALRFVANTGTREPDAAAPLAVCREALERGLIVIRAGVMSDCVRMLPPLTISDAELDEGLAVLSDAIDAAAAAGWN